MDIDRVPPRSVGTLKLSSFGVMKRLDLEQLAGALEAFDRDDAVGAILLEGASTEFCRGLDLAEFGQEEMFGELAAALERCFLAFANLAKPLVVALNGAACGFGATVLCHADVVIASQRARISMPFLDLGLLPEAGATLLLAERVGHLAAYRLIGLGEEIDALEAKQIGLVTKIEAEESVASCAQRCAERLARRPFDLLTAAGRLMNPSRDDVAERIRAEIALSIERLRKPSVRKRLARLAILRRSKAEITSTSSREAA